MQTLKRSLNRLIIVNLTQKIVILSYQRHVASLFTFYIKCFNDRIYDSKLVTYTAVNDVAQKFVDMLQEEVKKIYDQVNFKKPMILTDEDKEVSENSANCHICGGKLWEDMESETIAIFPANFVERHITTVT